VIFISFCVAAIVFWRITGSPFLLFNFGYIGAAVAVGIGLYMALPRKRKQEGRRLAQLLVGFYLLGYLGLFGRENVQLEGMFLHLFAGFFAASVIHYLVAKVFGPLVYGRGYCGWACWTSMVLDFLPFKKNPAGRAPRKWEWIRYLHFGLSVALVTVLWFAVGYRPEERGRTALIWLVTGNALYYLTGITLAFALKDNRAFCKYVCPITPILKLTSRFSMMKVEGKKDVCTSCGACVRSCPMNVNVLEYVQNDERVLSTECVHCMTCISTCPVKALDETFKFDAGGRERLVRAE
jgi:polyferredoxin